jgi:E3 ubiquitin-protein ligase synoviolin
VPFVDPEDAAIRQAQVNLARNLGREAFTSLFPGIPFPPEVEAENPRGSGSGGRANSSATAPTLTTQRSSSLLSPPAASVAGGHFASGLGVTAPPSAAGTGDNPLARFSLPDLPVPSAGEASLFQEPPSFVYASPDASTSSTYSNLAYGAYPRNRGGGGGTSYSASPFASVQQPPNIIERLETVRRRWTAQGTPPNASAAESSDGPRQNSADAAPAPEAESSTSAFTAAEKGKSKEVEEDSTAAAATEDDISPREAACRAAERRLGRLTQTTEDSTKRPESPGSSTSARSCKDGSVCDSAADSAPHTPFRSGPSDSLRQRNTRVDADRAGRGGDENARGQAADVGRIPGAPRQFDRRSANGDGNVAFAFENDFTTLLRFRKGATCPGERRVAATSI